MGGEILPRGKSFNRFEDAGDFMIGYTQKGEPFLFDHDDSSKVMCRSWHMTKKGYIRGNHPNGSLERLHRLIIGVAPDKQVDHINGVRHDNRKSNLRICNSSSNKANSIAHSNKKNSKYKGVYKPPGMVRYISRIRKDGITYNIGLFASEIEAAQAYDRKAIELFGEYAKTNLKGSV